jgi:alanyl-tRNA synthetase
MVPERTGGVSPSRREYRGSQEATNLTPESRIRTAEVARNSLRWFAQPSDREAPDPGIVTQGPLTSFLAGFPGLLHDDDEAPWTAGAIRRCLRPEDIQLVGRSGCHGSFFQMATFLSVGTAVLPDLARSAWRLTTTEVGAGGLGLPADRLRIVVSDDDVAKLWLSEVGVDDAQILRPDPATMVSADDPPGSTMCCQISLDRLLGATGPAPDRLGAHPLKLWSLHGLRDGSTAAVGIGLERVAMAAQDVVTFSETDQVRPILERITELTGTAYDGTEPETIAGVRLRVAADHLRSALMLAGTGMVPGSDGQALVLRKLIRRTARALRLLGLDRLTLGELLPAARDAMATSYPGVAAEYDRIARVIVAEDVQFRGPSRSAGANPESSAVTPPSLADLRLRSGPTDWRAYETLQAAGTVLAILTNDRFVDTAAEGVVVDVVLDRTPFFAARCGQASDRGSLSAPGLAADVFAARWALPDLVVHRVRVATGELRVGAEVTAAVDGDLRLAACQAHSATHVLQAALRERLGDVAVRLRSADEPGRLVIEIDQAAAWSPEIARSVELSANHALRQDEPVSASVMNRDAALASGALEAHDPDDADPVRVVEIGGNWSREICDGTHVLHTSQIGLISLTDSAISPDGRRRIEAVCGLDGFRRLVGDRDLVSDLSDTAGLTRGQLLAGVERLIATEPTAPAAEPPAPALLAAAEVAVASATPVAGTSYTEARTPQSRQARRLAGLIRDRLDPERPGVVVVTGGSGQRLSVVVSVNGAGVAAGLCADDLIRSGLKAPGSGRAELAEGQVDVRQRQRAIARIRTKTGVVSGSLAT